MMTNVDFEGFNDWSNQELVEARDIINAILELRKKEKMPELSSSIFLYRVSNLSKIL